MKLGWALNTGSSDFDYCSANSRKETLTWILFYQNNSFLTFWYSKSICYLKESPEIRLDSQVYMFSNLLGLEINYTNSIKYYSDKAINISFPCGSFHLMLNIWDTSYHFFTSGNSKFLGFRSIFSIGFRSFQWCDTVLLRLLMHLLLHFVI